MQRFVVGRDPLADGVAGATGVEIYRNNVSASGFAWQPGAGVQMADDLRIACLSATSLTFMEVTVTGGGTGSGPGFQATFQLFDRCPHDSMNPGQPVPGTLRTANLPNDGLFAVSLDLGDTPLPLSQASYWLAVTFSTNGGGWMLGDNPQIGSSNGMAFDGPSGCTTHFGGCGVACANFAARLFGTVCEVQQHLAYRAHSSSGFFFAITSTASRMIADDILPIDAPEFCSVTGYTTGISGPAGQYRGRLELFSNDPTLNRPLAPVPGTSCLFIVTGTGQIVFVECDVQPAALVPSARMWLTYEWVFPSGVFGPILTSSPAELGFSGDCFSIFGNPQTDVWSQCVWFFGGCEPPQNPCAIFYNSVRCLGLEPRGACCDLLTPGPNNCVNDVSISQCGGRIDVNAQCSTAEFDPPCDTGACCKPDQSCEALTGVGCLQQQGFWQPGVSCNDPSLMCPRAACITGTGSCTEAHENSPGCNNIGCCEMICTLDSFCCDAGWDSTCAQSAMQFCTLQTPPNNACASATIITEGTYEVNTLSATTDGPPLPPGPQPNGCDEGAGVAVIGDVWYNYTAPGNGIVTVDLCSDTDLDSRIAAYSSCTCPVTQGQTLECADGGCQIANGPSRMQFPVNGGQCYKIRVGGAPGPNATGIGTMTVTFAGTGPSCPSGSATFTNPQSGTVDARQPNPVGSLFPRQGIQTITLTAPAGADPACFSLCETASFPGEPNSIQSVSANGTTYTLTLARPITPWAVTRVAYKPDMGAPSIATFTSHPANVNGDTTSAPTDVLRIIDCLNNVNIPVNCPWGLYSQDIDQSGQFNPADVLRVIDLLNGADVFDIWNGTALPSATCTP